MVYSDAKSVINYIIGFLTGDDCFREKANIGYTADNKEFKNYELVIVPSGFFDRQSYGAVDSLPSLPLKEIDGVPLLFGEPDIERVGDTVVVHADIIASAFFMLSRYEEIVRRTVRDKHGRFIGKESLPARAGFIDRPIVDEYGALLRKWLNHSGIDIKPRPQKINKLCLTHDIDAPFAYRSWRNLARGILKEHRNPLTILRIMNSDIVNDPYFKALLELYHIDKEFIKQNPEIHTFIRSGGNMRQDRPFYWSDKQNIDFKTMINSCMASSDVVGLHSSYSSAFDTSLIINEKTSLESLIGKTVTSHRNHFLASREPEDMRALEKAGFTDDFTIGFADVAGFRLGTSHPVRYIDPASMRLSSSLTLHPLLVMDSTFFDYMKLPTIEAENYCRRLIEQVRLFNGDFTLLWHNTSIASNKSGWAENLLLYKKILQSCEL